MKDIKFGEIIRKGRERIGMTKSELARLMNVSHAAVSYWEAGTSFPTGPTLILLLRRLCIVQDVFPEFFLHEAKPYTPNPSTQKDHRTLEERLVAIEKLVSPKI